MKPHIRPSHSDWAEWLEERDVVIKSYDIERFKAFYRKWTDRGVYRQPLPRSNEVLAASLRKMVYNMSSATEDEKREAKKWLTARGLTTDI